MNAKNNNLEAVKRLPFDIIKQMFPRAVLMVDGQKWKTHYIGKKDVMKHGRMTTESYAGGEWKPDYNGRTFTNLQMAWEYAKMNYTSGHYKIKVFIPELEARGLTNKHGNV